MPSGSSAASSTTKPARQVSDPQMPNAVVKRSPRSMTRSPGLSRPKVARGPAVSMRWHDSGVPSHSSRRTASRSRRPGRSSASRCRMPFDVRLAACSKAASWSASLMMRRPSAGSMSRSLAFSTSPPGAGQAAELVDQVGRDLHPAAVRVGLPAQHADAAARPDALARRGSRRAGATGRAAGSAGSGPGTGDGASRAARPRPARSTRCRRGWPARRSGRGPGSLPRSAGRSRSGTTGWRCARGRR